tara:strand:- start:1440 stop:2447 length:1008 start_codon:yes stop_codon:yes gene_type:complete
MTDILTHEVVAYIFAFLMGLSMLIYTVLDGYDLGVGVLSAKATDDEKDRMLASIGPFWDANETWLVLGVGLLLVAFPTAHGIILTNLYLPVLAMLIGLIFRGVAIEFRKKVKDHHKTFWNNAFFAGSFLTAFAQGYMLGSYILGFDKSAEGIMFSVLVGLAVVAAYSLMGANWLIMRTEGTLQKKAIKWAKCTMLYTAAGIVLISITTPLVSARIFEKWFSFPEIIMLAPIPLITAVLMIKMYVMLKHMPFSDDKFNWVPFALNIAIFVFCFHGLAYSFFPYIVPEQLTITQAAAGHQSLLIILAGALVVLPIMFAYTFLIYRIFKGKATDLNYE